MLGLPKPTLLGRSGAESRGRKTHWHCLGRQASNNGFFSPALSLRMKKVREETMVFSAHTAEHKEGVLFSARHSFNSSFMSFDQALWSTCGLEIKK